MGTADDQGDVITAALLQLTRYAERLAALDEREAAHYQKIAAGLTELASRVAEASTCADKADSVAGRPDGTLATLDGLDQQIAALASRLTKLADGRSDREDAEEYRPVPSPRWWRLDGPERERALARLRAWVEQVYRPSYGHLSAALGACWEQHTLCLFGLDWLMELWSALYLPDRRNIPTLASQAEWQTRLLPALAEQMNIETAHCQHTATPTAGGHPPRGPYQQMRKPSAL